MSLKIKRESRLEKCVYIAYTYWVETSLRKISDKLVRTLLYITFEGKLCDFSNWWTRRCFESAASWVLHGPSSRLERSRVHLVKRITKLLFITIPWLREREYWVCRKKPKKCVKNRRTGFYRNQKSHRLRLCQMAIRRVVFSGLTNETARRVERCMLSLESSSFGNKATSTLNRRHERCLQKEKRERWKKAIWFRFMIVCFGIISGNRGGFNKGNRPSECSARLIDFLSSPLKNIKFVTNIYLKLKLYKKT